MYAEPGAWRIPAMCSLLITRRALLRIGGLDDSFRGLYEDQVLYAKIALHLRAVIDPRPMALYRQHDASACQIAIDAGEWQRIGPSEPERRYLEWMRTYVTEQTGGDAAASSVVARNLDHTAHGHHVTPIEPAPSLRSRVPAPARRVARKIRDRVRPPAPPTTVTGRWNEQFLAPIRGSIDGSTLLVEAGAGTTPRQAWSAATTAATRFDRVVIPLAVGATVDTATLLAGVGRRLTPHGTAYVVVPGPALDPSRSDAAAVVDLVHAVLPRHRVDVESFGNETTAASVDAPAAALGPMVDRHDRAVPVVLGITIGPARCAG
jgi:hypothetical protein